LTYYRPHWTGLTQYAARVAEGLAKKGHEVTVLCSQHDKKLLLRETVSGVKIVRTEYWFKFLRSVIMPGFLWKLIRQVKKVETVVVYLPIQEVLLVAIVARMLGKKLFLVHNGDLVLPKSCGLICRIVEMIYYWATSWSGRMADGILIQSEDYAQNSELLKPLKNKRKVVLPLFELINISTKNIDDFRKKYDLADKILIGYSGRFVEEKGVDYLLKSIPLIIKKIPNATIVLAGDYKIQYEKFWNKIKNLIEENKSHIKLLGLVKDPKELFTFYKSLDVYVQPSRTDCFPSSQIEAMLCGIPSVCTDIPGARWVVKKSGMGILVKPNSVKYLARGIIKAIKRKTELRKKYYKVRRLFDYQKTLDKYEKIFSGN